MARYSVRTFESLDSSVNKSKTTWAVLVNNQGSPFFWPNVFTTIHYKKPGKSIKTIEKVLRTLGMFYQWAEINQIELDEELLFGEYLSIDQVTELASFMRLKVSSQDKEFAKAQTPENKKIVSIEQVRGGFKSNKTVREYCSPEEQATRMRWIIKYLEFLLIRRKEPIHQRHDIEKHAKQAIEAFKDLVPEVSSASNDNEKLEGISKQDQNRVESAFRPESKSNPFTKGFIQHRNYLMWRIFYETGCRRAELRNIKIEDVAYSQRRIALRVSKTIARTVSMSSETSAQFHNFVLEYLSKFPAKARAHGYLFTNNNGGHISLATINQVFSTIRTKVPELPDFLSPHVLRRTWNDSFSEKIDSLPDKKRPSSEKEKQIRNRLQGWSNKSEMSERYARRHIRKRSDEIAESLTEDLTEHKRLLDDVDKSNKEFADWEDSWSMGDKSDTKKDKE